MPRQIITIKCNDCGDTEKIAYSDDDPYYYQVNDVWASATCACDDDKSHVFVVCETVNV